MSYLPCITVSCSNQTAFCLIINTEPKGIKYYQHITHWQYVILLTVGLLTKEIYTVYSFQMDLLLQAFSMYYTLHHGVMHGGRQDLWGFALTQTHTDPASLHADTPANLWITSVVKSTRPIYCYYLVTLQNNRNEEGTRPTGEVSSTLNLNPCSPVENWNQKQ